MLLLDTHVWVWSQLEPERLGTETAALLVGTDSVLHVSAVSSLEVARLVQGGQIQLNLSVDAWVEAALRALTAVTIDMTNSVATGAYQLPEPFHRDPADRILVATARAYDLVLLTADGRILEYPHVQSRDARL